ncbi:MAG: signal peptidase I [Rhodospirillales bacterium]|nr:signal peptidase I [Rhodospirillales bacterium]
MTNKKADSLKETVMTVVYAVLIAIAIRTVAYEPFNIPSGSMKPTLLIGDYLFVSKFSYGYSRYSFPLGLPLVPGPERVLFDAPQRGDVAVFKLPSDNSTDYIKRIIGLPGDTIQVVGGILHINGTPVKRERTSDFVDTDEFGHVKRIPRYVETLPNGRQHFILEERGDRWVSDNTREFKVPEGHFFAMGDNRDNSADSRFSEVGSIPIQNLVGRAEFLFFSVDGSIWKIWNWPSSLRFGRFFDGIE